MPCKISNSLDILVIYFFFQENFKQSKQKQTVSSYSDESFSSKENYLMYLRQNPYLVWRNAFMHLVSSIIKFRAKAPATMSTNTGYIMNKNTTETYIEKHLKQCNC